MMVHRRIYSRHCWVTILPTDIETRWGGTSSIKPEGWRNVTDLLHKGACTRTHGHTHDADGEKCVGVSGDGGVGTKKSLKGHMMVLNEGRQPDLLNYLCVACAILRLRVFQITKIYNYVPTKDKC